MEKEDKAYNVSALLKEMEDIGADEVVFGKDSLLKWDIKYVRYMVEKGYGDMSIPGYYREYYGGDTLCEEENSNE